MIGQPCHIQWKKESKLDLEKGKERAFRQRKDVVDQSLHCRYEHRSQLSNTGRNV